MKLDSSEDKNKIVLATSSALPNLPRGVCKIPA